MPTIATPRGARGGLVEHPRWWGSDAGFRRIARLEETKARRQPSRHSARRKLRSMWSFQCHAQSPSHASPFQFPTTWRAPVDTSARVTRVGAKRRELAAAEGGAEDSPRGWGPARTAKTPAFGSGLPSCVAQSPTPNTSRYVDRLQPLVGEEEAARIRRESRFADPRMGTCARSPERGVRGELEPGVEEHVGRIRPRRRCSKRACRCCVSRGACGACAARPRRARRPGTGVSVMTRTCGAASPRSPRRRWSIARASSTPPAPPPTMVMEPTAPARAAREHACPSPS